MGVMVAPHAKSNDGVVAFLTKSYINADAKATKCFRKIHQN